MRKQALPAAVCLDGFPRDPDFPQLETASDPRLMLQVFRRHLKAVSGKAYRIEECIPFRFRCRQSTSRCVLQYTLRVVDPSSGRRWDQWVTGLVYAAAGEAERLWRELRAADPPSEIPEQWLAFEPVGFIPDLQMLVQVFPYDRKLGNLRLVLGGALRQLEPLLLAGLEPGRWRAEQRTIEPMRYRTELGAALRYTLRARDRLTGKDETRRCYLKVYRNERGAQTFHLLRALTDKAGAGESPYRVVRPIVYVPELRTLALEEAQGTALQQMLLHGGDWRAALRAVARAVAAFNQADVPLTEHHCLADQLADVNRAASLVQWACPELRAQVEALTVAIEAGLTDVPPAPIHRDLKTDHIFLSDDRVCFIDFDNVAMGDPVRDPAHLYAYIVTRVGLDTLSLAQARAAAAIFAKEYFARVPPSWRERFRLHCAGALIEVAGGMFRRQERRWPERVAEAVQEAQNALSGGFM
ncbi:MAG: hypothetical protein DME24_01175 [Verrucomicrobia bacterium]|nr:MAG: hypothetical protein DME24_01175 [Verrucomicrobiota bacterium]